MLPHVLNAAVNVVPESGGFDPAEIVALLARWPQACFFAAPTMVKRLIAHSGLQSARLEHLKSIVYGGAPMYVEDCRAACAALGPRLAQIYGQGESPMTITAMSRALLADAIARNDNARLSSVGPAQTGIEIRIIGSDGTELAAGGAGEVCVRGPTVMQGYWDNPQATTTALADGWLHTGDVGYLDGDGFLTLNDRAKDLIISGGSNIYPREIEEVLQTHAAVTEVAVVGRHHPDWGEEVVACVVARTGADTAALERELDARCLESIARFKRPKAYVFLAELPKNNTGKVLKTVAARARRECCERRNAARNAATAMKPAPRQRRRPPRGECAPRTHGLDELTADRHPGADPIRMQVDIQVNASVAYRAGAYCVTSSDSAVSAGAIIKPATKASGARTHADVANACAPNGTASSSINRGNCRSSGSVKCMPP